MPDATRADCGRCDALQHRLNLLDGEGLEGTGFSWHTVDQSGNVSRQATFGDQLPQHLRERADHVVARARAPGFPRFPSRSHQAARPQLHDQLIEMATSQILNSQLAQLAAHRLEDVLVTGRGRRPDLVARTEPVRTGLLDREIGWLNIGPGVNLPLDFCQGSPCFLLSAVAPAQLFALAIDHTSVNGQLISHHGLTPVTPREFDAPNLWRQVATLSHGLKLQGCFGVRGDKPVNLRRRDAAGGTDLNPGQLPALEEPIDRRS